MDSWDENDELFVFGSLIDTEVLRLVTAMSPDELSFSDAVAEGYRCSKIAEDSCPVLIAKDGCNASGKLVKGLTQEALRRIVFFEGPEYSLDQVTVRRIQSSSEPDFNRVRTTAWYFRDAGSYTVLSSDWHYDVWVETDRSPFLQSSEVYMASYGKLTAEEADAIWKMNSSNCSDTKK